MLYANVSVQEQEKLLEELEQTSDAKWYRRLKIIHLSSQEKSVPQLATLFDLCSATIRDYITRDNAGGLNGVQRHASPGAPSQIPLTKAEGEELLHQSPSQVERLHTGAEVEPGVACGVFSARP